MVRGAKGIGGVGIMPSLIDMREEVRGGGGRYGKLEGVEDLGVRDCVRISGKAIGCPRGFRGRGNVGGWEEKKFLGKITKGSVWVDGEGDKKDFR